MSESNPRRDNDNIGTEDDEDVEGTVPQALILMNNSSIQAKVRADRGTVLAEILQKHSSDDDAIEAVYLRTLARKPTAGERDKGKKYIANVGNRAEAFEDLLWALINSTEFQTKR